MLLDFYIVNSIFLIKGIIADEQMDLCNMSSIYNAII